jgi:hypothetical protein
VTVRLPEDSVHSSHELDFDLDSQTLERVHGGSIRLRIRNDFAAGGTFRLRIRGDNIQPAIGDKNFTIATGESVQTISFTTTELRRMLSDETTTITITGLISAPGNQLTVTPGMEIHVRAEIRLILGYREEN